jgi:hypothetical protein
MCPYFEHPGDQPYITARTVPESVQGSFETPTLIASTGSDKGRSEALEPVSAEDTDFGGLAPAREDEAEKDQVVIARTEVGAAYSGQEDPVTIDNPDAVSSSNSLSSAENSVESGADGGDGEVEAAHGDQFAAIAPGESGEDKLTGKAELPGAEVISTSVDQDPAVTDERERMKDVSGEGHRARPNDVPIPELSPRATRTSDEVPNPADRPDRSRERSHSRRLLLEGQLFEPPELVSEGRELTTYYERKLPDDPDRAEAARRYLESFCRVNPYGVLRVVSRAGKASDAPVEVIEKVQAEFYETLSQNIGIDPPGSAQSDRIREFYNRLDLEVAPQVIFDENEPVRNGDKTLQAFVDHFLNSRDTDGTPQQLRGRYYTALHFSLVRGSTPLQTSRVAAHEDAHSSDGEVVVYTPTPDGQIYFWSTSTGFHHDTLKEGRANLLDSNCSELVLQEKGERDYAGYRGQDGAMIMIPDAYTIRDPDSDKGLYKLGAIEAVNLELLIERNPALFDTIVSGNTKTQTRRQLPQQINAIEPGLYERFRMDPWLTHAQRMRESEKLYTHILGSIYGINPGYNKQTRRVITSAHAATSQLFQSRLGM